MNSEAVLEGTPLSKADRPALRHRWEQPIFMSSALVSVAVLLLLVSAVSAQVLSPSSWQVLQAEEQFSLDVGVVLILLAPIGILMYRRTRIAKDRMSGVTVSEAQLAFVQDTLQYYCDRVGLKTLPVVVVTAGAKPSSYTSPGWKRHTITLSNLLVEIKADDGDRTTLRFALAREVGHIAAGHKTVTRQMLTLVTKAVPYVGSLLSRAEAYTADRWAAALAPDCASTYFGVEATGKFLWMDMDMHDMSARAGAGGVLETMNAYLLPLPPITWRVRAMDELGVFAHWNPVRGTAVWQEERAAVRNGLKQGYRLNLSALNLKGSHGAFWMPPKTSKAMR